MASALAPWPHGTALLEGAPSRPITPPWQRWLSALRDTVTGLEAGHGNASDLTTGTVPVARLGAGTTTVVANTETGVLTAWAPGLAGNTFIEWSGAVDTVVLGLAGGVVGQIVTVVNTGGALLHVEHFSPGAATPHRFYNRVRTGGFTSIALSGSVTYHYDGGVWVLVAHDQGAGIPVPYAATNFIGTGGILWDVAAGDVLDYSYRLSGRTLTTACVVASSTLTNVATPTLSLRLPGGYVAARTAYGPFVYSTDGSTYVPAGLASVGPGSTAIGFSPNTPTAPWPLVTNTFALFCQFTCEVQ